MSLMTEVLAHFVSPFNACVQVLVGCSIGQVYTKLHCECGMHMHGVIDYPRLCLLSFCV